MDVVESDGSIDESGFESHETGLTPLDGGELLDERVLDVVAGFERGRNPSTCAWKAGSSSMLRTTLMTAANPCLIALALDLARPSMEVGPWDLSPLMRDCSERVSLSGMGYPFRSQRRPAGCCT